MRLYRPISRTIEALEVVKDTTADDIYEFLKGDEAVEVNTRLNGEPVAVRAGRSAPYYFSPGDFIVRDMFNTIRVVPREMFLATHEPIGAHR